MELKDWGLSQLGMDIWAKKYQNNGESFEEWLDRVSGGDKDVKQLIVDKKFLFGGRILASRGVTDRKVTYSNCYVLPQVEDSIEGIYDTAKHLARTFSYGGGVGIDISNLRPKGSPVNNAAKTTSGAVSFMDTFSQVSSVIGQAGRRGALMISMDCNHPDIEDFIDAKKNTDKLEGCNISVRTDGDFIKNSPLMHKLAENNWDYAEPGILYWDNINKNNLLSEYIKNGEFEYAGVNPCLVGDTLIQTIEGPIAIKDLVGAQPYVYCMDNDGKLTIRQASKVWKTRENAQLVEIDFNRGKLICTPDHKIYTRNRGWVEAKDLKPKDRLNGLGFSKGNEIDERVKLTTDTKYHKHHRFIMEQMGYDLSDKDIHHKDGNHMNNKFSNLEVLPHRIHSKITNIGHECNCERDEKTGKFVCKECKCKPKKTDNVNIKNTGKNFIVKSVTLLNYKEDVYDLTVPEEHNFIANNIVVHNCAEEPLPAGGSCLLGAINLSEFVIDPFTDEASFDLLEFDKAVRIAVRALNDVLDEGLELHPLEIQRKTVREFRQIGLGIMGFADMLIKMGIAYGSEESLRTIDIIGMAMNEAGLLASSELAEEKGPFDKCDPLWLIDSKFMEHMRDTLVAERVWHNGLRNSQLFTIAPTGTISTMLGVSGGVEPIFDVEYTRTTKSLHGEDVTYKVVTPIVEQCMKAKGVTQYPEEVQWSKTINPFSRIDVQAQWQIYIDASISSTVNLPQDTTVEEVEELYRYAYDVGCKGLTIFRDGCARTAILNSGSAKEEPKEEVLVEEKRLDTIMPITRADMGDRLEGATYVRTTACGKLYITINTNDKGELVEVFIDPSKSGGCLANVEVIGRLCSSMLRAGVAVEAVIDSAKGVKCSSCARSKKKVDGLSCGDIVAKAIETEYNYRKTTNAKPQSGIAKPIKVEKIEEKVEKITKKVEKNEEKAKCPECGAELSFTGGCNVCPSCGWSKCN